MTDAQRITTKNKKIVIKPLKLSKQQIPVFLNTKNRVTLLKGESGRKLFMKHRLAEEQAKNLFKEDVIYESKSGDFFVGNPHETVTIVNRLNLITNSSRTIARYNNTLTEELINEKTSDNIARLIGQKNYDTVFSALCSVISQELKIRGMLALLTLQKKFNDFMGQTDDSRPVADMESFKDKKNLEEKCCQTEENCMDILYKAKQKKRIKRTQLTPYVVKDKPIELKKVVIDPQSILNKHLIMDPELDIKYELTEEVDEPVLLPELKPHLKPYLSEDSNDGSIGSISLSSIEDLLKNPISILEKVDQYTDRTRSSVENQMVATKMEVLSPTHITMLDGSRITVMVKPEDHFHIATPEILKSVTNDERMKLLWYQAYIDWKFCLHRDEDGNLPIHVAMLNNDIDLLRRQCLVLRNRNSSVDVTANNATPLQMSFFHKTPICTSMLLQYGADPLFTDADERSILHLACESSPEHVRAVITYCQNNAREILQDTDDLWHPALENKSKEQLGEYLLDYMCKTIDNQGYTPLMTASKTGMHACVKLLIDASPKSVNMAMPNCGNTALYHAVGSACIDAEKRGNKSKVPENFKLTVQTLMSNGADPSIANHSGQTVNDLLTEFNIADLSMLVANTITTLKYGKPEGRSFDSYMLVKEKDGNVNIEVLDHFKPKPQSKTTNISNNKAKPIILENITLPTTSTALNKVTVAKTMTNLKMVSPNEKLEKTFQVAKAMTMRGEDVKGSSVNNNKSTTLQNIARVKTDGVANSAHMNKLSNSPVEKPNDGHKTTSVITHFAKVKSISGHDIEIPRVKVTSSHNQLITTNAGNNKSMTAVSRNVKDDTSNVISDRETAHIVTSTGIVSVQNAVKRKSAVTPKKYNKRNKKV